MAVAGLGRKVWTRETLSSAELQGYLQDQAVMRFPTATARSTDVAAPAKSMVSLRDDARVLERYDGSAWRVVAGVPVFASLALRDAYFVAPNNAPVAGSDCLCNGVRMTHDGTAWRFFASGTAAGTTDVNGWITIVHPWGQTAVAWGPSATQQASDTLTYLAKPIAWSFNNANLTVRFTRTDTNAVFAGNPLSCSWWAQF